jgi:hypothetical protein
MSGDCLYNWTDRNMCRIVLAAFVLCLIVSTVSFAQRYVSPSGSDSNPGSFSLPYATITKAISVALQGDTIYVRGGTYILATTINISKSGTSANKYYLFAYQEERPILDFSGMAVSGSNRGISVSGSYWHIKGLDVKGAGDNGMNISGSNNVIEFCSFFENRDTGCQLGGGASNNQVINCDSYYNCDPGQGNADGFSPKLDVGTGNYFYGCRSWQNSDDGYDGYLRPSDDITTTYEHCWAFKNGYLKSGAAGSGNGNGFKMGGSDSKDLMHNAILKNCLAFDNLVKGFDQNNNKGSMTLYNCTAYNNGTNYKIDAALNSGKTLTVINCVALGVYGSLGSWAVQQTNSWLSPFTVTNTDFIGTDASLAYGRRNADGSLPNISYMHLASGSDLIDAGTTVGISYNGSAPDLGAFESGGAIPSSYSLTISSTNGTVSLNPNLSAYDSNSTVQMTAVPSTGYHFVNWSGDFSGSSNPSSIVMNGNKSVTANFAINTYTLTVLATNGTITKNPNQVSYDTNASVLLTAVAAAGYRFVSWSGDVTGTTNPLSVVMNSNKTITANFALPSFVLTINTTNGTVSKSPSQSAYDSNSTVQLTAIPAAGYHFVGWSGDISGSMNPVTMMVDGNKNITANFAISTFALTLVATNGAVSKNPDQTAYDSNSTVQLTAMPAIGYHFVNWSGAVSGTANPVSIVMNGNKTVTANFAKNTYTLTINATNGAVLKDPSASTYDSNMTVQLTAFPSGGYHFVSWSGDVTGSSNPIPILMDGNKNVTAAFAPTTVSTYSLNIISANGTVTKVPDQSVYDSNATVQLTALPASGYHFLSWSGDVSGFSNPISILMDGDKNITANYAVNPITQFSLNIHASNGSVTKTPDQSAYDSNATVHLTAVPLSGYRFDGWSGDIAGSGNPDSIIMNADKNVTASFVLDIPDPVSHQLDVNANWNMVSLPYSVANYSTQALFPTASSRAMAFDRGYVSRDSLIPMQGYWIKFTKRETISIYGSDRLKDSIVVSNGWNMIGSIGKAINVADIRESVPGLIQSSLYSYDGAYIQADTLYPGKAYWVKAGQIGQIIMDATHSIAKRSTSHLSDPRGMNSITLHDKEGHHQTLYFGVGKNNLPTISMFELPPAAPSGSFDVRFGSNRYVEVFPENITNTLDIPISISSGAYPISVSWNIQNDLQCQYLLDIPVLGKHKLEGIGKITMIQPVQTAMLYIIPLQAYPTEFSLSSNYPNPFNPSTRLTLTVPQLSHVDAAIYDILGRKVKTLLNGNVETGNETIEWNGLSETNVPVAGGIYFVRVTSGKFSELRKILLMK